MIHVFSDLVEGVLIYVRPRMLRAVVFIDP